MKRVKKWGAIASAVIVLILLVVSWIIYLSFPVIVTEESRDVAATPDAMFDAFMDFDYWTEYWDINTIYPPQGEIGVGTVFHYSAIEGYATLEIVEYVPGELIRMNTSLEGIPGQGHFNIRFEPSGSGSRVTMRNYLQVRGPLRVLAGLLHIIGANRGYHYEMIGKIEQVALPSRE